MLMPHLNKYESLAPGKINPKPYLWTHRLQIGDVSETLNRPQEPLRNTRKDENSGFGA